MRKQACQLACQRERRNVLITDLGNALPDTDSGLKWCVAKAVSLYAVLRRAMPHGWPAKSVRQSIPMRRYHSNAKANGSEQLPLPTQHGAAAIQMAPSVRVSLKSGCLSYQRSPCCANGKRDSLMASSARSQRMAFLLPERRPYTLLAIGSRSGQPSNMQGQR